MAKSKYALVSVDLSGKWDEIQEEVEAFESETDGVWVRVAKVTPEGNGVVTANIDILLTDLAVSDLFLAGATVNSARGYDFSPATFKKKAVKVKANSLVLKNPDGTEVTV